MHKLLPLSLLVVTLGVIYSPTPADAMWEDLLPALSEQIKSLWQTNELQFLGSTCTYEQKPRIRRFQLYYYGYFSCSGFPGIRGHARTRSRSGIMVKTIESFLNVAREKGQISEEVARIWLEGISEP